MLSLIKDYSKLDKPILNLIAVEFFVQLINVAFVAILPLYMKAEGYSDAEYAHFTSYRYFGMLALAVSLGIYIKNRKILPLFYVAAIGVPLFGFLILVGVHLHYMSLILIAHLLWGTCYTFIQIPVLPYILRNAPSEQHTLAITLNYVMWSLASIISSLIVAVFNQIDPDLFNERNLLFAIAIIGFVGVHFVVKIKKEEQVPSPQEKKKASIRDYDWKLIIKALTPTTIIAIGAGFTIPFISLFFSNVHNMSTAAISIINFLAACLVTYIAMLVPSIKKKYGYKKAVPTTQSLAIIALIIMATTQYYSEYSIAVYVAVIFYLLRQPLMNTAAPMTSEITMNYVGEKNREMTSALTSAIWSGSTYFSAVVFGILRHLDVRYVNIFLITAGMYIVGVIWYSILIYDSEKRGISVK
ncbi:MAG: MFS transporter [Bacteroidetes bacterium]|nr:MFS transporter [Bacteroidota bacterium]